MAKPSVTAILALYNGATYLREALDSILAQNYPKLDIIAIDDGSTDATAETLQTYAQINYHYQENAGVAAARNRAVEIASGEWLAFLDQDDVWLPNKLEQQINFVEPNPQLEIVLGQQSVFLDNEIEKPGWIKEQHIDEDHTGYHLGTALIRRSVFEKVGFFDPQYRLSSDSDWFFRAKELGIQTETFPGVVLRKRVHDENESAHAQLSGQELLKVVRSRLARNKQTNASNT